MNGYDLHIGPNEESPKIAIKKLRHKFMKRTTLQNDITDEIIVYFNNFWTCNNIDKNITDILDDETLIEKELRLCKLFPKTQPDEEYNEINEIMVAIENAGYLSHISFTELSWLKKVIHFAENIPICITIASAKPQHFGFPLVYVNKHFEKTTEYNRNQIIGKNCKFLQPDVRSDEEEPRHILMTTGVRLGIPTSVIITNVKKSGVPFHNLLTFKPVRDENKNYLYCIGIQTEITPEAMNEIDTQNVIDVINTLTNMKINIIS